MYRGTFKVAEKIAFALFSIGWFVDLHLNNPAGLWIVPITALVSMIFLDAVFTDIKLFGYFYGKHILGKKMKKPVVLKNKSKMDLFIPNAMAILLVLAAVVIFFEYSHAFYYGAFAWGVVFFLFYTADAALLDKGKKESLFKIDYYTSVAAGILFIGLMWMGAFSGSVLGNRAPMLLALNSIYLWWVIFFGVRLMRVHSSIKEISGQ